MMCLDQLGSLFALGFGFLELTHAFRWQLGALPCEVVILATLSIFGLIYFFRGLSQLFQSLTSKAMRKPPVVCGYCPPKLSSSPDDDDNGGRGAPSTKHNSNGGLDSQQNGSLSNGHSLVSRQSDVSSMPSKRNITRTSSDCKTQSVLINGKRVDSKLLKKSDVVHNLNASYPFVTTTKHGVQLKGYLYPLKIKKITYQVCSTVVSKGGSKLHSCNVTVTLNGLKWGVCIPIKRLSTGNGFETWACVNARAHLTPVNLYNLRVYDLDLKSGDKESIVFGNSKGPEEDKCPYVKQDQQSDLQRTCDEISRECDLICGTTSSSCLVPTSHLDGVGMLQCDVAGDGSTLLNGPFSNHLGHNYDWLTSSAITDVGNSNGTRFSCKMAAANYAEKMARHKSASNRDIFLALY